jgi:hypothetical protein
MVDQGFFNYIIFSNRIEEMGIKVTRYRNNEYIRHAAVFVPKEKEFGAVPGMHDQDTLATIAHHIYRFNSDIFRKCPVRNDTKIDTYFSKCDEGCAKGYIKRAES